MSDGKESMLSDWKRGILLEAAWAESLSADARHRSSQATDYLYLNIEWEARKRGMNRAPAGFGLSSESLPFANVDVDVNDDDGDIGPFNGFVMEGDAVGRRQISSRSK